MAKTRIYTEDNLPKEIPLGNCYDLKGRRFGKVVALYRVINPRKSGSSAAWLCKCDCGNYCVKDAGDLKKQPNTSCGCVRIQRGKDKKIDLIGQTFDQLTVVKEAGRNASGHDVLWLCQCSCGNTTTRTTSDLRRWQRFGSAHCNNPIHRVNTDIIGKRFGELEVIRFAGFKNSGTEGKRKATFECYCHACHTGGHIIAGSDLPKCNTCGCGKTTMSKGAKKINNILLKTYPQEEIKYELTFPDLISPDSNLPMHYDFSIFQNNKLQFIIEYDGQQHFFSSTDWNTEERLEKTHNHDRIKNQYCLDHDIKLYRIPYFEIDNIDTLEDILTNEHLVTNN